MKKGILVLLVLVSFSAMAQHQYEVLMERPNEKSLKGIISRQILLADSSFKWYAEGLKGFTVRTDAKEALEKNTSSQYVPAKAADVNEFRAGGRTAL